MLTSLCLSATAATTAMLRTSRRSEKRGRNIEKPLIVFLVTYNWKGQRRHFRSLQTHYLKAGAYKMVREQPALPWQVSDTVWAIVASGRTVDERTVELNPPRISRRKDKAKQRIRDALLTGKIVRVTNQDT
jgi:hypothetical protein